MKLLITGASGLLGISLAMEAMREYEVIGVDRGKLKSAPFPVFKADLLQRDAIHAVIDSIKPDWLVNCAALANLEVCEQYPELAKTLNTEVPGELAKLCAKKIFALFTFPPMRFSMEKRLISTWKRMSQTRWVYIHAPN